MAPGCTGVCRAGLNLAAIEPMKKTFRGDRTTINQTITHEHNGMAVVIAAALITIVLAGFLFAYDTCYDCGKLVSVKKVVKILVASPASHETFGTQSYCKEHAPKCDFLIGEIDGKEDNRRFYRYGRFEVSKDGEPFYHLKMLSNNSSNKMTWDPGRAAFVTTCETSSWIEIK